MTDNRDDRDRYRQDADVTAHELMVHVRYLKERLDNCVTKEEFTPVQRVVYGLLGAVLLALVSAFMMLVIKR